MGTRRESQKPRYGRNPIRDAPSSRKLSAGDKAIEELLGCKIENVLSRVFTAAGGYRRARFEVRDKLGDPILSVDASDMHVDLDDDEGDESSRRAEFVLNKLRALFCPECGQRLIDGEEGQCISCESTAVMDLLRMRDELA